MDWATLFDRAPPSVTVEDVQTTLAEHRRAESSAHNSAESDSADEPADTGGHPPARSADDPIEPRPTRVVADADVLAADVLVGGDARRALEPLWQHDWLTLVASDQLLSDAERVIAQLADAAFAADWRTQVNQWREPVGQPAGDHPALASAYRGGAMQLLSFDDDLTGVAAGAALTSRFPVSVRTPAAFATLVDPERLYPSGDNAHYRGPDREPRDVGFEAA